MEKVTTIYGVIDDSSKLVKYSTLKEAQEAQSETCMLVILHEPVKGE